MILTISRSHFFLYIALLVGLLSVTPVNIAASNTCNNPKLILPISWPPYITKSLPNTKSRGPGLRAIEHIFKTANLNPKVLPPKPWLRALRDLDNGVADISVMSLKYNNQPADYIYSEPWIWVIANIWTLKSNTDLQNDSDIAGKKVVTYRVVAIPAEIEHYVDSASSVDLVDSTSQMISMLSAKRVDAALALSLHFKMILESNNEMDKYKTIGPEIVVPIYFKIHKDNPCASLIPKLNEIILEFNKSQERSSQFSGLGIIY